MNLALWYMREGLDEEGRKTLRVELDKAARLTHPIYELFKAFAPKKPRVQRDSSLPSPRRIGKWVKPEGWTPPGWKDDATAYKEAQRAAAQLRKF